MTVPCFSRYSLADALASSRVPSNIPSTPRSIILSRSVTPPEPSSPCMQHILGTGASLARCPLFYRKKTTIQNQWSKLLLLVYSQTLAHQGLQVSPSRTGNHTEAWTEAPPVLNLQHAYTLPFTKLTRTPQRACMVAILTELQAASGKNHTQALLLRENTAVFWNIAQYFSFPETVWIFKRKPLYYSV